MSFCLDNESTTSEPPPWNGQQPKPQGGLEVLMHLTGNKSSPLNYVVVKTQNCVARINN